MRFLFGAVIGFTSVLIFMSGTALLGLESPSWIVFTIKFLVSLLFAVAVHEAGHLFAGWRVRYTFFSLSVGPFVLRKTLGRLRLAFEMRGPNVIGGLTIMFPRSAEPSRKSSAWFIAGGPLASVSVFLFLAATAFLLRGAPWVPGGSVYLVWLTAVMSLVVGLLSLMPENSGGIDSDGSYLLKLWKGDASVFPPRGFQQLIELSLSGVRPRDLPKTLLLQLETLADTDQRVVRCLFLHAHHLDRGEQTAALNFLDEAVDHVRNGAFPLLRPTVFLEKAFAEAFFRDNAALAAAFLEKGKKGYSEKMALKRAEAAVFLARGEVAKARAVAEEALDELPAHFDAGGVLLEHDLLREILRRAGSPFVNPDGRGAERQKRGER